jgi:hypothetical protein
MTQKNSFESMNEPDPKPKKTKKIGAGKNFDFRPYYFETKSGRFWFQNFSRIWLVLP